MNDNSQYDWHLMLMNNSGNKQGYLLKLLGGVSFFKDCCAIELNSQILKTALAYLSIQALPVHCEELTNLLEDTNVLEQLDLFGKQTGLVEWLDTKKRVRLHVETDVKQFQQLVAEGQFNEALKLYRGEKAFLPELSLNDTFESWRYVEEARLKLLLLEALRGQYELLASSDYIQAALSLAREVIEHDPLDEYTHLRIMQLELHEGNHKACLQQYSKCCEILANTLDVEPLSETQNLAQVAETLHELELRTCQND